MVLLSRKNISHSRHIRRIVLLSAGVVLALAIGIIRSGVFPANNAQTQLSLVNATLPQLRFVDSALVAKTATAAVDVTSQSTRPAVTASVTPKTCSPDVSYGVPSSIDLTNDPSGVTLVVDNPTQYEVYGDTIAQIESQIARCAPDVSGGSSSAEFTAETGYRLGWQYSDVLNANDQCTLGNVKVGQHINMVLPLWQPTAATTSSVTDEWQHFVTSLQTHENGHVAIDTQYAQTLLTNLESMPATDCNNISQAANTVIANTVAAMNQANDTYDAVTNHGATQGAVLPNS